ncbi:uncharacterized protein LOC120918343 [Rana temporaria]|uniref:uncharacterized protein LOC120918343 n=1 Tax=Rana temporaria TaxID=8407 RepID=UPI001AADB07B|nr:uncharacterized protein LOC120918343 [Rana temporaria]
MTVYNEVTFAATNQIPEEGVNLENIAKEALRWQAVQRCQKGDYEACPQLAVAKISALTNSAAAGDSAEEVEGAEVEEGSELESASPEESSELLSLLVPSSTLAWEQQTFSISESQNFNTTEPSDLEDEGSISSCSEDTIQSIHEEESDEESDESSAVSEIDEELINLKKRLANKYKQPGAEDPPAFPVNPLKRHRSPERSEEEPAENRIGHTHWCICENCRPMPTHVESECCGNLEDVKPLLEEGLTCVTHSDEFIERCLNKRILMYQMSEHSESSKREYTRDANRCLQRGAYRIYTRMIHGFLGKCRRIPIPSCVVWAIRDAYPDFENQYTGFKWSSDYNASDMAFE